MSEFGGVCGGALVSSLARSVCELGLGYRGVVVVEPRKRVLDFGWRRRGVLKHNVCH